MKKVSNWLIGFIVLFSCTKEEITPRRYPRVRTKGVNNITAAGARLEGEITFSSTEILDHGFIWSQHENLDLNNSEAISLGIKTGKGAFNLLVERSLDEGKVYYVKAYAKSTNYTVYGEIVEFVSLGSKAPLVTNLLPNTGTWGDTVR